MNAVATALRNAHTARDSGPQFRDADTGYRPATPHGPVLVAVADPVVGANLIATLREGGYDALLSVGGRATVQPIVVPEPSLLIVDAGRRPDEGRPGEPADQDYAPVILLATGPYQVPDDSSFGPVMAVLSPTNFERNLLPAVQFALTRYSEIRALRSTVHTLGAKLHDRNMIEQAKGLLLTRHGMPEPAAYRWLQRTAMNHRMSLPAVAGRVVEELAAERGPGQRTA